MRIPQSLPRRATDLSTTDHAELSAVQPERGREYVQTRPAEFRGSIRERTGGGVGALQEFWSCALRVRCARPRGYVAFAVISSADPIDWCATEVEEECVLEVGRDWELTTRGPAQVFSIAVDLALLEAVEAKLAGGQPSSPRDVNRVLRMPPDSEAGERIRSAVRCALDSRALLPRAQRALDDELLNTAVRIRRSGAEASSRAESWSRRRRAVRAVEEYLDAHEREVPSLADLCAVAGVSERTLEYAFLEQLDTTPARYLRLRRLNRVRGELLRADPGAVRVTEVAMRWGFWELGRFARDYRRLFGELPSQTGPAPDRRTGSDEVSP